MRFKFAIPALIAGALALAACGGSGSDNSAKSATAYGKPASGAQAAPMNMNMATGAGVQVGHAQTKLGDTLVDANGMTLYAFTSDTGGVPTCTGGCAQAWPPLTITGAPHVAAGLDAAKFTTVAGADGTQQLKAGKWPLYRFAGDTKPGDTNGQGSEGFFAVPADGTLIK